MKKWTMWASPFGNRKWFLLRHGAEKCLKKGRRSPWILPAISSCAVSWGLLPYWWLGTMNWRSCIQRGVGGVSVGAITEHPPPSCCHAKTAAPIGTVTPSQTVSLKPTPARGQMLAKPYFSPVTVEDGQLADGFQSFNECERLTPTGPLAKRRNLNL